MTSLPDFESIKQTNILGQEYWSARDLMGALGYESWQNFEKVIAKALKTCKLAQQDASKHFIQVDLPVSIGHGTTRGVKDYHFTRYALCLALVFADLKKPKIMQAVAYFTLNLLAHIDYIDTAQQLGVSIPSDLAITEEQRTIEEIVRSFKHLKSVHQYKVGPYRVDLYFPDERIAIECDERGHQCYPPDEEHFRQSYIERELRCTFIRYNPDCAGFHVGDIIYEIMMLIRSRGGKSYAESII